MKFAVSSYLNPAAIYTLKQNITYFYHYSLKLQKQKAKQKKRKKNNQIKKTKRCKNFIIKKHSGSWNVLHLGSGSVQHMDLGTVLHLGSENAPLKLLPTPLPPPWLSPVPQLPQDPHGMFHPAAEEGKRRRIVEQR